MVTFFIVLYSICLAFPLQVYIAAEGPNQVRKCSMAVQDLVWHLGGWPRSPAFAIHSKRKLHSTSVMAAMASMAAARVAVCVRASSGDCRPSISSQCRAVHRLAPHSLVLRASTSSGVEPDLQEDAYDIHATAGEELEDDFPWGKADGAHSWHKGDDGTFMEGIREVMDSSGGPTGGQGAISWLFLPGLVAGMAFNLPDDYLFIYTVLFIFAFIGIEMAKPSKEVHFEPEMYRQKK